MNIYLHLSFLRPVLKFPVHQTSQPTTRIIDPHPNLPVAFHSHPQLPTTHLIQHPLPARFSAFAVHKLPIFKPLRIKEPRDGQVSYLRSMSFIGPSNHVPGCSRWRPLMRGNSPSPWLGMERLRRRSRPSNASSPGRSVSPILEKA
jgi:hypothetical protein